MSLKDETYTKILDVLNADAMRPSEMYSGHETFIRELFAVVGPLAEDAEMWRITKEFYETLGLSVPR